MGHGTDITRSITDAWTSFELLPTDPPRGVGGESEGGTVIPGKPGAVGDGGAVGLPGGPGVELSVTTCELGVGGVWPALGGAFAEGICGVVGASVAGGVCGVVGAGGVSGVAVAGGDCCVVDEPDERADCSASGCMGGPGKAASHYSDSKHYT